MNSLIGRKVVHLDSSHISSGRSVHLLDGHRMDRPSIQKIAEYPDESGFYLLYLDDQGKELTDTLHDTMEEAMDQAEWEFGVSPTQWKDL